jgi:hypothetical protein
MRRGMWDRSWGGEDEITCGLGVALGRCLKRSPLRTKPPNSGYIDLISFAYLC